MLVLLLCAAACKGPGRKAPQQTPDTRSFPMVEVPGAYTDDTDRLDYAGTHYWDRYLSGTGRTDSACVLGVPRPELEQALANYIAILDMQELPAAQKQVEGFFKGIEGTQQRLPKADQFYTAITQIVASYLYDPNSPMRDEDLFLPFARGLAGSRFTRDDMKPAYRYQAMMCELNQRGTVAPDIRARDADGGTFSLHGVKAPYIILFFSNPGCQACRELMESINSGFSGMVDSGRLAVVNIYIDEDVEAWKNYAGNYPPKWYNGYDYTHSVRDDVLYDVRAIPSIYLLDGDKRILAKDATIEKISSLLERAD